MPVRKAAPKKDRGEWGSGEQSRGEERREGRGGQLRPGAFALTRFASPAGCVRRLEEELKDGG